MNTREARALGVESGYQAGIYGEFTDEQLLDFDEFMLEASEICQNKRQYAGEPGENFTGQPNSESLWNAFDEGETIGIKKAWNKLADQRKRAEANRELVEALELQSCGKFDGVVIGAKQSLSDVPKDFRGSVLEINDHGNVTLWHKTARKFKEIASRV